MLRYRLSLLLFVLGSLACGTDRGHMITSSATIDGSRDFEIVRTNVAAQISLERPLCMFTFQRQYPYAELMEELHAQSPLARNEAFVNLREDRSARRVFFFACSEMYTLTADVVRFSPASQTTRPRRERSAPTVGAPVGPPARDE